jgi:hypothetical protein
MSALPSPRPTALFPAIRTLLCVSQDEYYAQMRKLRMPHADVWLSPGAAANSRHYVDHNGRSVGVVCIDDKHLSSLDVAEALAHEASHLADYAFQFYGEDSPSAELRAYAVGFIWRSLADQYKAMRLPKRRKA